MKRTVIIWKHSDVSDWETTLRQEIIRAQIESHDQVVITIEDE